MSTQYLTPNAALETGIGLPRRALDLVVSLVGLGVLAPLMAGVAVTVRVTSPGPALFRQRRVGEKGVCFTMYKFRSMRLGAAGPELCTDGDPRVTRFGGLLRRTRIDEVPQLFNVLRGDMTLVGPRPETVDFARRYPPWCREVLRHRPGMTGPVQLRMGTLRIPTGEAPDRYYLTELVPRRVKLDLEYLANPTLRQTLALLAQTAGLALRRSQSGDSR